MTSSPKFSAEFFPRMAAWACVGLSLLCGCESSAPSVAIPSTPTARAAKPADAPANTSDEKVDEKNSTPPVTSEKSDSKRDEAVASAAPVDSSAVASNSLSPSENTVSSDSAVSAAPAETKGETTPVAKPAAPGEVIPITFEDINLNMQADIVFRPWMLTDRVKELEGKRVRLSGYMHGSVTQLKKIKEFVMLKNTECKFGAGGQADHLINVKFQGDASASYTNTPVQVEGVLKLNPFQGPDGNTWSVFDLLGESIKPVRKL